VGFLFRIFAVFTRFSLVLLLFGFFFVLAMLLALGNFVRFVQGLGFILIKIRPTDQRVGFRARLRLFVLGFDQSRGERDRFFITQARGGAARRFG
jgi:hypothetical protein